MKKIMALLLSVLVIMLFAATALAASIDFDMVTYDTWNAEDEEVSGEADTFNAGDTVYISFDSTAKTAKISAKFACDVSVFESVEVEYPGNFGTAVFVLSPSGYPDGFSMTATKTGAAKALQGAVVGLKISDDAPTGTYTITCEGAYNSSLLADGDSIESGASITINVIGNSTPEPSVDTFEATTTIGNGGEAVHSTNVGGVESGSAFRIGFTIPEAATSKDAIFGITAGGEKRYSPKQIGILNGIEEGSPVVLDVSFLNGRDNSSYQSKTVTAVSVILANSDGTQFFFSDAADANAKAPVVAE